MTTRNLQKIFAVLMLAVALCATRADTAFSKNDALKAAAIYWDTSPENMKKKKWPNVKEGNFRVYYHGVDVKYAEAIAVLCNACNNAYIEKLGISLPDDIRVFIGKEKGKAPSLHTNSFNRIVFEFEDDSALAPPTQGGSSNVYGFCHELGHLVMTFDDDDFSEAWADYLSAIYAMPYVSEKLGGAAWPEPYDYLKIEGPERTIKRTKEPKSRFDHAVRVLYELDRKHGTEIIRKIISEFREEYLDRGAIELDKIEAKAIDITGDKSIAALFDEFRSFSPEEPKAGEEKKQ